jgi:hypothetical protein
MVATGANPWLLRQSHRTPGGVTEAVDVGLGDRGHVAGWRKRMAQVFRQPLSPAPGARDMADDFPRVNTRG